MKITKLSGYETIYELDACTKERSGLFGKNREEARKYAKWLQRQLLFLDGATVQDIHGAYPNFERLANRDGVLYFSIRRTESAGNPRVICAYVPEEEGKASKIMLTAFKETGPGGYMDYVDIAEKRLSQYGIIGGKRYGHEKIICGAGNCRRK